MSRGKSLACFLNHSNSSKLDFLLLWSVSIISGSPPPTPRVNSVMQKKCHLWKAINTITTHSQMEQRAKECRKAVNSDQVLPCSLLCPALQAAGVSFPASPGDLCPHHFLPLYSKHFFLGVLSVLPTAYLCIDIPYLNQCFFPLTLVSRHPSWIELLAFNSCRGLKPLWGTQEFFSHLILFWWHRLDTSGIFKRCSLSASLTFLCICLMTTPQAQLDQWPL